MIRVWSRGPINREAGRQVLYIEAGTGLYERPVSTRALRPLHGFEFVAEGEAIDGPGLGEPAQLWIFDPQEVAGTQLDGFTLRVLRMAISWPDAPLRFEREWHEGERVSDIPVVVHGGATPADYHRLADAYQALIRFTENERTYLGGSPKGPRKGRVWSRRQCLEWWKGWADLDREPTQAELAADMDVRDPETAVKRWRDIARLHWPPTQDELDELEAE